MRSIPAAEIDRLQVMYETQGLSIAEICRRTGHAPATISRHFKIRRVAVDPLRGVRGPRPSARRRTVPKAEYQRWYHIKQKYGISRDDYDRMLDEQQGRCAICGKMPDYELRVDHDHATGRVRGLLCAACNVAIANLGDTVAGVEAALSYLRSTA